MRLVQLKVLSLNSISKVEDPELVYVALTMSLSEMLLPTK